MTISAIDPIRTVPVQEDLSTSEMGLQIIRGYENMFRVDMPYTPGVSLRAGEFGVLKNDGMMDRPSATPNAATYLVMSGTDRFDTYATGKITLVMNSNIVFKTNKYSTAGTYEVGTLLTVKDLGAGEAHVSPAANGEFVVGKVREVGQGYLTIELFPVVTKKS